MFRVGFSVKHVFFKTEVLLINNVRPKELVEFVTVPIILELNQLRESFSKIHEISRDRNFRVPVNKDMGLAVRRGDIESSSCSLGWGWLVLGCRCTERTCRRLPPSRHYIPSGLRLSKNTQLIVRLLEIKVHVVSWK